MTAAPNRWLVTGTLQLATTLALRSGDTERRPAPKGESGDEVDCALLALDHEDRPYLPGTSLKGALRAWLESHLPKGRRAAIDDLFGHAPMPIEGAEEQQGRGGRLEFWDAFLVIQDKEKAPETRMAGRTAIDRKTRTAAHQLLAHGDYLAAGNIFSLTITGDDLDEPAIDLLLAALHGFQTGNRPIRLGSGRSTGRGAATFTLDAVRCMDRAFIATWLNLPDPPPWRQWLEGHPHGARLTPAFRARAEKVVPQSPATTTLDLVLDIDGPFAVGDPTRYEGQGHPDLEPMLDEQGRPLLPGSSLKGALRAQALRIWRTVHGPLPEPERKAGPPQNPLDWLFGTTGWQGVLQVGEFREAGCCGPARIQEFVAVDRFTGGVAGSAKFKAKLFESPTFAGTLRLDLARGRQHRRRYAKAALGLLALTLRDLGEGDITLGHGRTKGMGTCRSRPICLPDGASLHLPRWLEAFRTWKTTP